MSVKKPVSAAQKAATKRFEDKNYDKILLRLQKDSVTSKENIQKHAGKVGESVNGYITKAIENRIKSEEPTTVGSNIISDITKQEVK